MTKEEWDKYYELSKKHQKTSYPEDSLGREMSDEDRLRRMKDEALLDYVRAQFRLQEHYNSIGMGQQWKQEMDKFIVSSEARRAHEEAEQRARYSPVVIRVLKPKRTRKKK